MVDKQCTQDGIKLDIIEDDIKKANQRVSFRKEMHGGGYMLEKRIMELKNENRFFGIYLFDYVTN